MKLLYVTNGVRGSGGLERVLSVKTDYLIEKLSYEIHFLTLNNGHKDLFYDFNKNIIFHDVKIINKNPINFFLSYKKGISKTIENINPDCILVCDDGLKGLLFPIIFRNSKPKIYERHAARELNIAKNGIFNKFLNYSINKFDSFVVLTEGNKKDWPGIKCNVIPNPNSYIPIERIRTKQKTVLAVGTQSYNKGYDLLINAWEIVNKKCPDWKLKIYGKKNSTLGFEKFAEDKRLSNSITFYSPIKDIYKEYEKASIFVLSSRTEGFGMVLIEAMSFGTPCVAFNCPHGPSDIIKNNEDGLLVNNYDVIDFANKIIKLIENENIRTSMGKKALYNIKRYSIENIIKNWEDLFKKVVNNK